MKIELPMTSGVDTLLRLTLRVVHVVVLVSAATMLRAQDVWERPVTLVEINGPGDDYAPAWNHADGVLVFTQERSGRAGLYAVDGRWHMESVVIPDLTVGAQISYASWSRTGIMVFSAFRKSNKGSVINLMSRSMANSVWGPVNFIPECISDEFTGHASISPSGLTMVFASDREGGLGKLDLWMCKRSGAVWDTPVHMGELLNSAENEITPFLVSDDTLYFAGDGFGGRGGYDVYRTTLVSGEWQPPVPVDDINTSFNESDFVILPSGTALFASDRPGGKGGLDLYSSKKK